MERRPEEQPAAQDPGEQTPMMRQYLETKAQHPDCILFFRLGDFYEMFFEDALKASEILQITLTSRAKGDGKVPMCGVPYHAARRYLAKLIDRGLKVALCDQIEPPGKGPGIVRRQVVRVVTPGTNLDDESLEPAQNQFLAALAWGGKAAGLSLLDGSTGDFFVLEAQALEGLVDELSRPEVKELLVPEELKHDPELVRVRQLLPRPLPLATLERAAFEPKRAAAYLKEHLGVASLSGYGLEKAPAAVAAAGAALRYFKETQRTQAGHVDRLSLIRRQAQLVLDEPTRANLEVLRRLQDGGRQGSLLGVLDRTVTAPGGRMLARWLAAPLASLPEIDARLDAVEELVQDRACATELTCALKGVVDLERILGRLGAGLGNGRDLLALGRSLNALPALARTLEGRTAPLLRGLGGPLTGFTPLAQELERALLEEPSATLKEGGIFRPGYHAELDELVALSTQGKDFLLQLETRERARTGISSLKIRYTKVFGYFLEVTKANLHLVPKDYQRKQTTVGGERYITEELKAFEEKVLTAEERRNALEYELFEALRAKVLAQAGGLKAAAQALATADVLASLARCAAEYGYVRPLVEDSLALEIEAGRHPVVERMLHTDRFVPNDLILDPDSRQLLLITGPNMAGKSTIMRQVALTVLMAQLGSFVPARRARIGLCDRIFTRVGASDNLSQGQSTFMVEMAETANILHHATGRSLVVLDEIGRGTATFDGLSIAWAVAEHLHDQVRARTLFATHYHELTTLAHSRPRLKNASVAVGEADGRILFLHKLVEGGASRSYGIEVARLAGVPNEVLRRARAVLSRLEAGQGVPAPHEVAALAAAPQLPLFVAEAPGPASPPWVEELQEMDLNALTPLEALNLLARWKESAQAVAPSPARVRPVRAVS